MHQVTGFQTGVGRYQVARRLDILLADGPDLVYAALHQSECIVQIAHPLVAVIVVKQFLKDRGRRCKVCSALQEPLQLGACLIT